LGQLGDRGVTATFFVEGLNAEIYPDLLREIDGRGHEVAFHAWRHEQWDDMSPAAQVANLERGLAAFRRIGLGITGLRPPGGQLGAGGTGVLREAGLRYCSPAGAGAGCEDGVALLPFQWRHLDASCVLPPLGAAREQIAGSRDPVEPGRFVAWREAEIDRLWRDGGYLAIVLHPFMLGWLGEGCLAALLDRVAAAAAGDEVWVARCVEVAEHVLASPERFGNGAVLDSTSWA
jgi:peptidoglycan/xylan/chitin deacetylase (PgdA/CDA1 family)